jgi:hypothetical protein
MPAAWALTSASVSVCYFYGNAELFEMSLPPIPQRDADYDISARTQRGGDMPNKWQSRNWEGLDVEDARLCPPSPAALTATAVRPTPQTSDRDPAHARPPLPPGWPGPQ